MYKKINLSAYSFHFKRNLAICDVLQARRQTDKDPGVRRRANLYDKRDRMQNDVDDLEDIEGMESDFSEVDRSLSAMNREQYHRRVHIGRMMTIKKFFSGPKPPNMLTWAERQEIKRLHEKDPEEWSLDVLSECFPATRETISKILKTKWVPESLKKLKKRDALVLENWKRLADGSLQVDPQLLQHLKKFLGRREEYLAALSEGDLSQFLPKPPEERTWNQGKMSSILESYERKLLELTENEQALIEGNKRIMVTDDKGNRNSNLDEIQMKEEPLLNKNSAPPTDIVSEHFGNARNFNKRHVTLAELRDALKNRMTLDEANNVDNSARAVKVTNTPVKQTLSECNKDSSKIEAKAEERFIGGKEDDGESYLDRQLLQEREDISTTRISRIKSSAGADMEGIMLEPDVNNPTKLASADPIVDEMQITRQDLKQSVNANYEYKSELERREFEKEEESIKGTFFWGKEGEIAKPTEKKPLIVSTAAKHSSDNRPVYSFDYPERIKVPKDKRGSGLTFQVNDCFYDDDGEFLYRVPGIHSTKNTDGDSQNT